MQRQTLGQVARQLTRESIPSPKGNAVWSRSTLANMLGNSTYMGQAAYGRTRVGERRPQLRPARGRPEVPRRPYSSYPTKAEEQIFIPVPAVITAELFAAVREQLEENQKRHRQGKRGVSYLLQGLIVCERCGRALYGKPVTSVYKGQRSRYTYYRCPGLEPYRFGGGDRLCDNRQVRIDRPGSGGVGRCAILMSEPARLKQEYQRRVAGTQADDAAVFQQTQTKLQKARQGVTRLIDAFADGARDPPGTRSGYPPRSTPCRKLSNFSTNPLQPRRKSLQKLFGSATMTIT